MSISGLVLLGFLTIVTGTVQGQHTVLSHAAQLMEALRYEEAIEVYTLAARKSSDRAAAVAGMAEAYRRLGKYEEAKRWYEVALALPAPPAQLYYFHGLMCLQLDSCGLASASFDRFLAAEPAYANRSVLRDVCSYRQSLKEQPALRANLRSIAVNSPDSDLGVAYYENGIVFSSDRPSVSGGFDLYFTRPAAEASGTVGLVRYDQIVPFAPALRAEGSLAVPCFNALGTEMFFTRNQSNSDKNSLFSRLEIHMSRQVYGALWAKSISLPFNRPAHSSAHPALSPDGKRLFFSSDRPGGMGGKDLYVVYRQGETWSEPENLGPAINTAGDELYPFMDSEGWLYFATDSRPGLGKQDIFRSREQAGGQWSPVENPGSPINSAYDDFGLIMDNKAGNGYLVSNRPGGVGKDDIYYFSLQTVTVEVLLRLAEGGSPRDPLPAKLVAGDRITPVLLNTPLWEQSFTNSGCFTLVNMDSRFKPDTLRFCTDQADVNNRLRMVWQLKPATAAAVAPPESPKGGGAPIVSNTTTVNVGLAGADQLFERVSSTTGSTQALPVYRLNVYYPTASAKIDPSNMVELRKLLGLLKQNPAVKVEISSHTDSRGGNAENLLLSQRRAETIVEWLVAQGISKEQLLPRGYGESQPVNECRDGVHCTEDQYQKNRRTEIRIIN